MHVEKLFIHPLKSAAGIALTEAHLDERGVIDDRRWMVIEPGGQFVTARKDPMLNQVRVRCGFGGLRLSLPDGSEALAVAQGPSRPVEVWSDTCDALDGGDEAAALISGWLGRELRLVHMPASTRRPVDPDFAQEDDTVSFADGYPVLLATTASLDDLNARLAAKSPAVAAVTMRHFRPNIVVSGAQPWAEDTWRRVRIGNVTFDVPKTCSRCVMVNVDPMTGATRATRSEPLRTLATFRKDTNGRVVFGQNAIPRFPASKDGTNCSRRISIGDEVTILE